MPGIRRTSLPTDVPPGVLLRAGADALDPDDYAAGFAVWSGTSFVHSGGGLAVSSSASSRLLPAPRVAGHCRWTRPDRPRR